MPSPVHIIMPNRIGDAVLSLPMLSCLRQLLDRYDADSMSVTAYSHLPLCRLFNALRIFDVRQFGRSAKLRSWFTPPDKALFLSTTTDNIGYRARTRYGMKLNNKTRVHYDVDLPFLDLERYDQLLPAPLIEFLTEQIRLPGYALKHFGVCLELGFTVEQILETFRFDEGSLDPGVCRSHGTPPLPDRYVAFCMEAAYNRRRAADRRWDESNFIDLAERVHGDYGLDIVFIGLFAKTSLPERPYFTDLRSRLSLEQTVEVLYRSRCYIGNDTGPLHLANLLKKHSLGIYHRDQARPYWPLFSRLNTVCVNTESLDEIAGRLPRFMAAVGGVDVSGVPGAVP